MKLSETLKIDYFRVQLNAWRICGALDLSEGRYWSWSMLLCILVYLPTPMLLRGVYSFEDPVENNFSLSLTVTSLSNLMKFCMYVAQLTKMVEVQSLIGQLDARVSGESQSERHRNMTEHLLRMSKLFQITYAVVFIIAAVPFVFETELSLPMPMWFPFDWKNSMVAYIGALVFQEIGYVFQIMQCFAADSFPPLVLYLISEQCQLLILRISEIGYGYKTLEENEQDLVNCIRDQNALYRLLDVTKSLVSYPMMVQFMVIGINIAITLFVLIFYVETLYDRIYYLCFLLGITVQTYPLCYYGTMVQESFAELHYAVFCSNWVDQSASYRGHMLILAERTKRMQLLLAGNLVPIHLSTYVACWKGAYSFFTLMADRDGLGS
uniref:Odorant receptor 23a n=1 Tax=Drosophila melanogaster TaxID=7227 RepID=OR23A_DROME|nr:odorant receptor 23a [Drosophila melanogaster]P81912.1 RecName: Full=Odorant receptor 23a [Drosophila melanogaster]AAD26360.1 odorant receptor DOR64 [Drosophila melanogaster]AAF51230.3 odorant receptor 23a [Drosophila melanogaster]|eukprot:NP_523458.3 odorant receptor 23a [Drosophila melanogaster]